MAAMRMKDDDWDAVIDTNLKSVFRLMRAVTRPMKQRFAASSISSVVGASAGSGARPATARPRRAWLA